MTKLGASLAILIAAGAGAAHAADLPTTEAPPAPAPPNYYASVWTWLNSSAADCPISSRQDNVLPLRLSFPSQLGSTIGTMPPSVSTMIGLRRPGVSGNLEPS